MDELTPEQIAHRKLMDEVNKAYTEEPIDPSTLQLKKFNSKILERGFKFDPREICKMIDAEAKRMYQEVFDDHFRGQHLDTLTAAKDEVIKWYVDEEERFEKFKTAYLAGPSAMMADVPNPVFEDAHKELPVSEVSPSDLPSKVVKINKKKK